MRLALARIDDRLVHGQVIEGCCGPLRVHRILLANDEAANDPLQARLYRAASPPDVEMMVSTLEDAAARLLRWQRDDDGIVTLLVVENPRDLLELLLADAPIERVNLGGLHHRAGTREFWPGFYLDDDARDVLRAILDRGIGIEVQTVPGAPATDARAALEGS